MNLMCIKEYYVKYYQYIIFALVTSALSEFKTFDLALIVIFMHALIMKGTEQDIRNVLKNEHLIKSMLGILFMLSMFSLANFLVVL